MHERHNSPTCGGQPQESVFSQQRTDHDMFAATKAIQRLGQEQQQPGKSEDEDVSSEDGIQFRSSDPSRSLQQGRSTSSSVPSSSSGDPGCSNKTPSSPSTPESQTLDGVNTPTPSAGPCRCAGAHKCKSATSTLTVAAHEQPLPQTQQQQQQQQSHKPHVQQQGAQPDLDLGSSSGKASLSSQALRRVHFMDQAKLQAAAGAAAAGGGPDGGGKDTGGAFKGVSSVGQAHDSGLGASAVAARRRQDPQGTITAADTPQQGMTLPVLDDTRDAAQRDGDGVGDGDNGDGDNGDCDNGDGGVDVADQQQQFKQPATQPQGGPSAATHAAASPSCAVRRAPLSAAARKHLITAQCSGDIYARSAGTSCDGNAAADMTLAAAAPARYSGQQQQQPVSAAASDDLDLKSFRDGVFSVDDTFCAPMRHAAREATATATGTGAATAAGTAAAVASRDPAAVARLAYKASLQKQLSAELASSPLLAMVVERLVRQRRQLVAAAAAATTTTTTTRSTLQHAASLDNSTTSQNLQQLNTAMASQQQQKQSLSRSLSVGSFVAVLPGIFSKDCALDDSDGSDDVDMKQEEIHTGTPAEPSSTAAETAAAVMTDALSKAAPAHAAADASLAKPAHLSGAEDAPPSTSTVTASVIDTASAHSTETCCMLKVVSTALPESSAAGASSLLGLSVACTSPDDDTRDKCTQPSQQQQQLGLAGPLRALRLTRKAFVELPAGSVVIGLGGCEVLCEDSQEVSAGQHVQLQRHATCSAGDMTAEAEAQPPDSFAARLAMRRQQQLKNKLLHQRLQAVHAASEGLSLDVQVSAAAAAAAHAAVIAASCHTASAATSCIAAPIDEQMGPTLTTQLASSSPATTGQAHATTTPDSYSADNPALQQSLASALRCSLNNDDSTAVSTAAVQRVVPATAKATPQQPPYGGSAHAPGKRADTSQPVAAVAAAAAAAAAIAEVVAAGMTPSALPLVLQRLEQSLVASGHSLEPARLRPCLSEPCRVNMHSGLLEPQRKVAVPDREQYDFLSATGPRHPVCAPSNHSKRQHSDISSSPKFDQPPHTAATGAPAPASLLCDPSMEPPVSWHHLPSGWVSDARNRCSSQSDHTSRSREVRLVLGGLRPQGLARSASALIGSDCQKLLQRLLMPPPPKRPRSSAGAARMSSESSSAAAAAAGSSGPADVVTAVTWHSGSLSRSASLPSRMCIEGGSRTMLMTHE